MISISSGTAGILGLSKLRPKTAPTAAYIMLGSGCSNNCKFCSKSRSSRSGQELLSRVDWADYDEKEVFSKVKDAYDGGKIKRLCFQVVDGKDSLNLTHSMLENLKKVSDIPVCVSAVAKNIEEAKKLFDAGMDRICIALDAASEEVYNRVKGKGYLEKIELITELSKKFPGKITTHLIVGLGETQMDMAEVIAYFSEYGVITSLFAFTPIKGTEMENHPQPKLETYRKIQIINYLLQNKHITLNNIIHESGIIKGFKEDNNMDSGDIGKKLYNILAESMGAAFMTSGCPDCNRPYYNESATQTPYNYPYKLSQEDMKNAIELSGLF